MNLKPSIQRIALAGGLFFILSTAHLFTPGQFMDGATYAAVARNLAEGLGTPWDLFYTPTLYPHFVEHPPLHIWLQSLFFHAFNDHWWVEDVYGLVVWVLTAIGIDRLGRWSGLSQRALQWALLLWTLIPVVTWSYGNNVLETTLSACMVWAAATAVFGMRRNQWLYSWLAGIWVAAGFLVKGPVALFPWALPFFWHLTGNCPDSSPKRMAKDSVGLMLGTLVPLGLLWLLPDARTYLEAYWNKQVVHSIEAIQTVENRWFLPANFAVQLIVPLIVALGVLKFRPIAEGRQVISPRTVAFFLIALSSVLPMMISLKQRDFYATPAYPFAALALAFLLDGHKTAGKPLHPRVLWQWTLALWALGFGLRTLPEVHMSKDFTLRQSIHQAAKTYRGQTLYVGGDLFKDWNLHAKCARVGQMYLAKESYDLPADAPRLIYKDGRVFVLEN